MKEKMPSNNVLDDDDDELLLDIVKGRSGAKKKLAVLNKSKLAKAELDALFLPEDYKDEDLHG
jgi:hypothetical protein